ncbi:unnamed protein product [Camellia sinensis]
MCEDDIISSKSSCSKYLSLPPFTSVGFAAEDFHGFQEQVMSTSSRSHKMVVRVQRIEAALAPLEKVILAQKSHLHFAYTAGYNWHSHLQNEQNHFIYGDLSNFIMDSYEECSDPPHVFRCNPFEYAMISSHIDIGAYC